MYKAAIAAKKNFFLRKQVQVNENFMKNHFPLAVMGLQADKVNNVKKVVKVIDLTPQISHHLNLEIRYNTNKNILSIFIFHISEILIYYKLKKKKYLGNFVFYVIDCTVW